MNSEAGQYALSFIILGNQTAAFAAASVLFISAAVFIFSFGNRTAKKVVRFSILQIVISAAVMLAALNLLSAM